MGTRGLKAKKPSLNLFVFRARAPRRRRAPGFPLQFAASLCLHPRQSCPLCPAPPSRRPLISASIPRAFGRALRSPSDSAVFNAGFCAFYCNICSRGKSPVCCTLANKMFSQSGTNLASKDRKILR